MQGTLNLYLARETDTVVGESISMIVSPALSNITDLIGSSFVYVIDRFDTWCNPQGNIIVPCVAFADGTDPPNGPRNTGMLRLWQMALMRKGATASSGLYNAALGAGNPQGFAPFLTANLFGNCVIAAGDDDFLEACISLLPPVAAPPVTTTP